MTTLPACPCARVPVCCRRPRPRGESDRSRKKGLEDSAKTATAMSLSALHGSVRGLVLWASRPPILGGAGKQVVYSLLRVPVHTAYG